MDNLYELSISEASSLLKKKELSPVDLVASHLLRINETDNRLNSFITVLSDKSQKDALQAEKEILSGQWKGNLHGIPIGLKDLYYTKGIPTTVGSKIYKDFIPDFNATVVDKLTEAGAVIIGKLQMHEFALGTTSHNPHYGPAKNPWNTECVTGGSSGGSASAVSGGQCMGALGSDTGGSIRIPSALCGIVGMKPTFGRVSRYGVFPLSSSLDTVGPMTRTVKDNAIMLNAIAGHDINDSFSAKHSLSDYTSDIEKDISGIKIGNPQTYFYDVIDKEVVCLMEKASEHFTDLGAKVEPAEVPILEHTLAISGTILLTEAAEIHSENIRTKAELIGNDVKSRLQQGALTSGVDYVKSQRARTIYNQKIDDLFKTYDILVSPTVATGAPLLDDTSVDINGVQELIAPLMARLTRPQNITGLPTISLPIGFTSKGLPVAMQLTAPPFQEARLYNIANQYEKVSTFKNIIPSI
ncbi:MAG: amidase [SAR202 cluster bacterium]|nr:amidase [SAR202 cluster bacterium]HJO60557.1 amidase [SAR202 cluster bacterium]